MDRETPGSPSRPEHPSWISELLGELVRISAFGRDSGHGEEQDAQVVDLVDPLCRSQHAGVLAGGPMASKTLGLGEPPVGFGGSAESYR
jgi:hypothetical protein